MLCHFVLSPASQLYGTSPAKAVIGVVMFSSLNYPAHCHGDVFWITQYLMSILYLFQCWKMPCCVGVKMVESLFEDTEKRQVCLTLAQTFLLQDWMTPDKNCCTKVCHTNNKK